MELVVCWAQQKADMRRSVADAVSARLKYSQLLLMPYSHILFEHLTPLRRTATVAFEYCVALSFSGQNTTAADPDTNYYYYYYSCFHIRLD